MLYHVHKSLPLVPTLNQMNQFQIFPPYFSKIQSNISPSIMRWSSSGLFLSSFLTKTLYAFHTSPMCTTCPAHLILLDFHPSLCNVLHPPITPSLLGPNIFSILFSYTLYLCPSLNVSHPYIKKVKKIYFCTL